MAEPRQIIYLDTVDSTNRYARRERLPAGTIVYTFRQRAGRGRLGRPWLDIEGKNLALSVIFDAGAGEASFWRIALLSLPMAALLKALSIHQVWIKWPNDILAGGKKIAGVLAETVMEENHMVKIIAGIGINVNPTAAELALIPKPATSLYCETGRLQEMRHFAEGYITLLAELMDEELPVPMIRQRWLTESGTIGRSVEWASPAGPVRGHAVDVDEKGLLHLETATGTIQIAAGDLDIK